MAKGGKVRTRKAVANLVADPAIDNNIDIVDEVDNDSNIVDDFEGPADGSPRTQSAVAPGRILGMNDDLRELNMIHSRLMAQGLIREGEIGNASHGRLEGHQEINPTIDRSFLTFDERYDYHLWIAQTNEQIRRDNIAEIDRYHSRMAAEAEELRLLDEQARTLDADQQRWEAHLSRTREAEASRILLEADRVAQQQAVIAMTATNLVEGLIHVAAETVIDEEGQRAQARLDEHLAAQDPLNLHQSDGAFSNANLIAAQYRVRVAREIADERDRNLVMGNIDGGYSLVLDIYDPAKIYVMPAASLVGYLTQNPREQRVWKPDRDSANAFAASNGSFRRVLQNTTPTHGLISKYFQKKISCKYRNIFTHSWTDYITCQPWQRD